MTSRNKHGSFKIKITVRVIISNFTNTAIRTGLFLYEGSFDVDPVVNNPPTSVVCNLNYIKQLNTNVSPNPVTGFCEYKD